MSTTGDLFDHAFRTAEEPNHLYCHQDFLQRVEENKWNQVGKRAALLLERLAVDERRQHYKSTQGVNKGWRRSRLGGNQGSHFYAWWAPRGAAPLRAADGFDSAPTGSVFLRDIRHHDDHSELMPQTLAEHYLPVSVADIRSEEYVPSPMTGSQTRFVQSRGKIRIVKGYPGSGKTTALWHAADRASVESTLYVTYSKDLAALARSHFLRFSPSQKQFQVLTFPGLVRKLLVSLPGETAPYEPEREARLRFVKQAFSLPARILGPWLEDRKPLYDEAHAHLVGSALPAAIGRFPASTRPRLEDRVYRDRRREFIGGAAADALLEVVNALEKREPGEFHKSYFPELLLAWDAVARLRSSEGAQLVQRKMFDVDCIAVDEAQDLTPLEALVIVELAAAIQKHRNRAVSLLIAGDEAQTVRATDFEWGWFQDLVHHRLASPQDFKLGANLRSPRRIAELINASWDLYTHVGKQDRPGGAGNVDIEDEASDQLVYCAAVEGAELDQLLRVFAGREGLAIVSLGDEIPAYIPEDVKPAVLTASEAKGLDFQAVCVLDPGKQLRRIKNVADRVRRDHGVVPLTKRLAIDQLRVAISRPTERIYFLDVNPSGESGKMSLEFLSHGDEGISPVIPAVVVKSLEEEQLPVEERIALCESDARQYLEVKPEMAWSRAKQAVSLLGAPGSSAHVEDSAVRGSALGTLCRVSFCLAFRRVRLAAELGHPDLYREAIAAADGTVSSGPFAVLSQIARVESASAGYRVAPLIDLLTVLTRNWDAVDSWLSVELQSRATEWLRILEDSASSSDRVADIVRVLPAAYKLFEIRDGEARSERIRERAVRTLLDAKKFADALEILELYAEHQPKLVALCYEGLQRYGLAAETHRKNGNLKDALRNYRAVPDLTKTMEVMREMGGHPAEESVAWMLDVDGVLKRRPQGFGKAATEAEKTFIAQLLESNMGAPRTPRKTVAKTGAKAGAKTGTKKPRVAKADWPKLPRGRPTSFSEQP